MQIQSVQMVIKVQVHSQDSVCVFVIEASCLVVKLHVMFIDVVNISILLKFSLSAVLGPPVYPVVKKNCTQTT